MLSLSPAKLLVILVIALIVLGPDKLPDLARQAGAVWHDLRKLRTRLEGEVRGAFPDLPSPHRLTQAVRSPLSFLDDLADQHAASTGETAYQVDPAMPSPRGGPPGPLTPNGNGRSSGEHTAPGESAFSPAGWDPAEPNGFDDPSMN